MDFNFIICVDVDCVFFFKQKTAYEVRIRDWGSYVFSSDLLPRRRQAERAARQRRFRRLGTRGALRRTRHRQGCVPDLCEPGRFGAQGEELVDRRQLVSRRQSEDRAQLLADRVRQRSEEHTSELQSLMRISYALICLKKKN